VVLEVMDHLGYDAFSPGRREFCLGRAFLEHAKERASFQFVTSNLVYADDIKKTWGKPYVIKDIHDIRVAVFGILPIHAFERLEENQGLSDVTIIDPEQALEALLPGVRKKADVILLLSSCGFLETVEVVKNVPGIDLAITSGRLASTIVKTEKPPVFQADMKGEKMGVVELTIDHDSGEIVCKHSLIGLYGTIGSDPSVLELIKNVRENK